MSATKRSCGVGTRAIMLARLAGAFGCVMAAACPASGEPQASDLAGRWVNALTDARQGCGDAGCQLAYDLVPCGNGWCGLEVKVDKTCGRTAMRLDAGASHRSDMTFTGSYERVAGTQPYTIKAQLYAPPPSTTPARLMLFVEGSTDGTFQPFRRMYPMQMRLTRVGDAACRGEAKTS